MRVCAQGCHKQVNTQQLDNQNNHLCSVNLLILLHLPLPCPLLLGASQDHKLNTVSIKGVTDPDAGDTVTLKVTSILQNEGTKANDTSITGTWACPDASISSTAGQVQLAGECLNAKSATVAGRTYLVKFTATDSKGASCTGSVSVCVKPGTTACTGVTPTIDATKCA
jgi:hypothetical protein